AAVFRRTQQRGKTGSRVEAREAKPVQRSVASHQGGGVKVADKSVIFDAGGHEPVSPLGSNSSGLWVPDVLVQLELHTDLQTGLDQPLGQMPWSHSFKHRTQQEGEAALQVMLTDGTNGPVKIPVRGDYKLDLIRRFEEGQVVPAVAGAFAAVGA